MSDVWRLSKHGKFRMEDGYVMLCHCRYLHDFRVPVELHDTLLALRGDGLAETDELRDEQRKLLSDLRKLKLLVRAADDPDGAEARRLDRRAASTVWDRMAYNEDVESA